VVVTVAVAVEVVRAQIIFPDGTTQETAFPGDSAVPTGAAYTRTAHFPAGSPSGPLSNEAVPNGQELVVLKVIGWNTVLSTLDSRLPFPNQNTNPIVLAMLIREDASNNALFEMDFPDGAVVVGQGRQPYLAFRDASTFNLTTTGGTQVITVIGYLRPNS
jgi:hypothetical protein